jgi:hypothetical protein
MGLGTSGTEFDPTENFNCDGLFTASIIMPGEKIP